MAQCELARAPQGVLDCFAPRVGAVCHTSTAGTSSSTLPPCALMVSSTQRLLSPELPDSPVIRKACKAQAQDAVRAAHVLQARRLLTLCDTVCTVLPCTILFVREAQHCVGNFVGEVLTLPLNTPPLLDHMLPADCAAAPADDRRRRCCGSGTATTGPAVTVAVPASAAVWSPLQRLLFGRCDGGGGSSSLRRRMRRGRSTAAAVCGSCGWACPACRGGYAGVSTVSSKQGLRQP